jgi:UPF0042 nucleotide-binding protein
LEELKTRGLAGKELSIAAGPEPENLAPEAALVFMEAGDSILLERWAVTETIPTGQAPGLYPEGWAAELENYRKILEPLRSRADLILNSGYMTVQEEADRVAALAENRVYRADTALEILSFGYRYGIASGDAVIDVRFIPNPYYVYSLRPLTGRDKACAGYVFNFDASHKTLEALALLAETLIRSFREQGKPLLRICIGCTGGQHRSVAMAEALGSRMQEKGCPVTVRHREMEAGLWPRGRSAVLR